MSRNVQTERRIASYYNDLQKNIHDFADRYNIKWFREGTNRNNYVFWYFVEDIARVAGFKSVSALQDRVTTNYKKQFRYKPPGQNKYKCLNS